MVDVISVIDKKIEQTGVTLTFLSKKTGLKVNVISSCLLRKRNLKASELIALAKVLDLKLSDFATDKAS